MRLKIGNFKGPQGKQGETGKKGDTGETGQRGSRWTSGTAITGTDTIGTKFLDSGITDALAHDCYINVNTGNLYECTVPGTADVAKWAHIGNIKGPTGATGPVGSISDINNQKPTYSEASSLSNIESGETVQLAFGKLKKALSVLISHYTQKATQSILGHVKLSNSAAITTPGEYALDAIEKNASVEGTLANMIGQVNSNLNTLGTQSLKRNNDITQTVDPDTIAIGVYQYWGIYFDSNPFDIPHVIVSFNAQSLILQIGASFAGTLKFRTRGASAAEWTNWHTVSVE